MTNTPRTPSETTQDIFLNSKLLMCASWMDTAHKAETFNEAIMEVAELVEQAIITERTARMEAEKGCESLSKIHDSATAILKLEIKSLQKERDEALAELRKSGEAFRDIQDFYCDTARGGNPNFAYDKSTGALSLPLMKKVLESGG